MGRVPEEPLGRPLEQVGSEANVDRAGPVDRVALAVAQVGKPAQRAVEVPGRHQDRREHERAEIPAPDADRARSRLGLRPPPPRPHPDQAGLGDDDEWRERMGQHQRRETHAVRGPSTSAPHPQRAQHQPPRHQRECREHGVVAGFLRVPHRVRCNREERTRDDRRRASPRGLPRQQDQREDLEDAGERRGNPRAPTRVRSGARARRRRSGSGAVVRTDRRDRADPRADARSARTW